MYLCVGFTKKHPIYIEGDLTRQMIFENVISRDNGLEMLGNQDGGFIGDITFDKCQFQYNVGGQGALNIFVSGPTTTSQIRGLRFADCVFLRW